MGYCWFIMGSNNDLKYVIIYKRSASGCLKKEMPTVALGSESNLGTSWQRLLAAFGLARPLVVDEAIDQGRFTHLATAFVGRTDALRAVQDPFGDPKDGSKAVPAEEGRQVSPRHPSSLLYTGRNSILEEGSSLTLLLDEVLLRILEFDGRLRGLISTSLPPSGRLPAKNKNVTGRAAPHRCGNAQESSCLSFRAEIAVRSSLLGGHQIYLSPSCYESTQPMFVGHGTIGALLFIVADTGTAVGIAAP